MTHSSNRNNPIGFFDSGVGGISVLKEAIKLLPNENFIYFGDSKNAPYGTKSTEEIKKLSFNAADLLIKKNVKAIVVACNTATSAAIEDLRNAYTSITIIGIEPALKPAVELSRAGKIVIMATPVTLAEKKFNNLMMNYATEADIVPLPCPGLAELIESGKTQGPEVAEDLRNRLRVLNNAPIASIVLGCTHYPFVKNELSIILGLDVPIIDGSYGTAKQLKRQLIQKELLKNEESKGSIEILNSLDDPGIIELSYKLLRE